MTLRSWIRNERGAAAVEFALIMVPLLGLVVVALQTGIVFFMEQSLQTATHAASRQLMTGAAQSASESQSQFVTSVCTAAPVFPCSGLMVDVQSGSTFSSISTTSIPITYSGSGAVSNQFQYSPGNPGDIVIVRVMYNYPLFGGALIAPLANQPGNKRLLVGTVVFKNEPYS